MNKLFKVLKWLCMAFVLSCVMVVFGCFCTRIVMWSIDLLNPIHFVGIVAALTVVLAFVTRNCN